MRKIISTVAITSLVLAAVECCGNAVMAELFPSDAYLQTAYWESAKAFLNVGAVVAAVVAGVLAYRWLPTICHCVRAEKSKSLAESIYWERQARIEWNRRS